MIFAGQTFSPPSGVLLVVKGSVNTGLVTGTGPVSLLAISTPVAASSITTAILDMTIEQETNASMALFAQAVTFAQMAKPQVLAAAPGLVVCASRTEC